uniref:Uncharacterized protein n=1 Tax=Anguilla anguilla TaxID=7936 RepID=A0A0E9S7X5_ANGAN
MQIAMMHQTPRESDWLLPDPGLTGSAAGNLRGCELLDSEKNLFF